MRAAGEPKASQGLEGASPIDCAEADAPTLHAAPRTQGGRT